MVFAVQLLEEAEVHTCRCIPAHRHGSLGCTSSLMVTGLSLYLSRLGLGRTNNAKELLHSSHRITQATFPDLPTHPMWVLMLE